MDKDILVVASFQVCRMSCWRRHWLKIRVSFFAMRVGAFEMLFGTVGTRRGIGGRAEFCFDFSFGDVVCKVVVLFGGGGNRILEVGNEVVTVALVLGKDFCEEILGRWFGAGVVAGVVR